MKGEPITIPPHRDIGQHKKMKTMTKLISLSLLLLIVTALPAAAQLATLNWDQSSQPEVVGYKVYYKVDTPTFPFNGTTLAEGASPITVDGSTTTSLTVDLPEDGNIYYFTATAISDTGLESSFSEIIASEWIPYLLAPTGNEAVSTAATFSWDLPPTGYNVSYELHYGTDPNLTLNAAAIPPITIDSGWLQPELLLAIPIALLLALLTSLMSGQAKRLWTPVRVGICIGVFALQAACGGGGGGEAGVTPGTVTPDPPALPQGTTVVSGIYGTDYLATGLEPGTQYYWKIVAIDETGFPYESVIQSFTTLNN